MLNIEDDAEPGGMLDRGAGGCDQPLVLERVFETVADYEMSFELINRYSSENPHHALGFRAGQWFETTEQVYWYFLECLPPLHMTSGGFVMSECTTGDLYESFMGHCQLNRLCLKVALSRWIRHSSREHSHSKDQRHRFGRGGKMWRRGYSDVGGRLH